MHIHVPSMTAPVSSKKPSILPSVATSTVGIPWPLESRSVAVPVESVTVAVESVTVAVDSESVTVAVESVTVAVDSESVTVAVESVAPASRTGHLIMILDHDLHALNHRNSAFDQATSYTSIVIYMMI